MDHILHENNNEFISIAIIFALLIALCIQTCCESAFSLELLESR